MRLLTAPLITILLVAWAQVDAQTGAASSADAAQLVVQLENQIEKLRFELAQLRGPAQGVAPDWTERRLPPARPIDATSGDVLDAVTVRNPIASREAGASGVGNLIGTAMAQRGRSSPYVPGRAGAGQE